MLDIVASLLKAGIELVFCLTILCMYLHKENKRTLLSTLTIGLVSGGIISLILYFVNKNYVRLEMGDVVIKGIVVGSLLLFLSWLHFDARRRVIPKFISYPAIFLVVSSLMLDKTEKIIEVLFPVLTLQNGLNSEWITHVGAAVGAIILLVLLSVGLIRITNRMGRVLIVGGLLISFVVQLMDQTVELLQFLFGLQIIPLVMWVFDILMPLVNNKAVFFYIGLVIMSLLLALFFAQLQFKKPAALVAFHNPAEQRKQIASERSVLRWFYSLTSIFVLVVSTIVGQQVHAMKGIEEKQAVQVTPESGHIHIAKSDIKEKELHVYSCPMEDGTEVRFIAIRKMGESYGIALDACEICGVAGYYQKDGQIICKKCGSVVSTTTVGFKGGCNPIPIEYEQKEDGTIDIPVSELEKHKNRFK